MRCKRGLSIEAGAASLALRVLEAPRYRAQTQEIERPYSCAIRLFQQPVRPSIIARAGRALCLYLESLVRIQSVAMRSAGPNCENFVLRVAQDQKYLDQ